MRKVASCLIIGVTLWVFVACTPESDSTGGAGAPSLFSRVSSQHSGITFVNKVTQSARFNFLTYQYIYNGGGVAVADFDQDGLDDLFFTANQGGNRLYRNQGDLQFEDVTKLAGAAGSGVTGLGAAGLGVADPNGWTTGVSVADFNDDGLPDLYLCKSGELSNPAARSNRLYLNKGNFEFEEAAQRYGLAHRGFSVQAYFIDYDHDGDQDMYLVNHRPDFNNARKISMNRNVGNPAASDRLFRNDNGRFTDVTKQAGLENHAWGLSAAIGDFNGDGRPDIYVANDYIQPDQLYINQGDGTFKDEILSSMAHIPYNSMGSDYADIDNDLNPDLMVLDMLAEDHVRGKENMATMDVNGFRLLVESGYHHTYMANMLYINNADGSFKEIGQLAGVSGTDWSWAPLIADFDNDGWKDLFVANGISRDLTNQDYRQRLSNIIRSGQDMTIQQAEQLMPANKLPNYAFRNLGDWRFEKIADDWGLDVPVNSNGAAYGDLDNDGDLELIVNNYGEEAMIFRNNSEANFLKVKLKSMDATALHGATVKLYTSAGAQLRRNYRVRGFQSVVADVLHFGLGQVSQVDSLVVELPMGGKVKLNNVAINQTVEVTCHTADDRLSSPDKVEVFEAVDASDLGITYAHAEDDFDDFAVQTLLPQKQSVQGPPVCVGDLNGDGLDDLYFGGAAGQAGAVYLQQMNGRFAQKPMPDFVKDKGFEDQGALLLDIDGDDDLDLYVASGGYQFCEDAAMHQDRLYLNDGSGRLQRSQQEIPVQTTTKTVVAVDFDGDSDLDLFVGGSVVPCQYPLSGQSYLLENNGQGALVDVTANFAPPLLDLGLVNEVITTDFDGDGDQDLAVAGEWMPITFLENSNGRYSRYQSPQLEKTHGWWQSVVAADLNGDGLMDFVFGNHGENNKFHPTSEKPLHIYAGHFDGNDHFDMMLSKVYKGNLVPVRGKQCSTEQNPILAQKITSFRGFAESTMADIYGDEFLDSATHLVTQTLSSVQVLNQGNGKFQVSRLPSAAQAGPTRGGLILDVNGDDIPDFVGVGCTYEAEVETVRYDANTGYVLLGDGQGGYVPMRQTGLKTEGNVRHICQVHIGEDLYLMTVCNGGPPGFFKLRSVH